MYTPQVHTFAKAWQDGPLGAHTSHFAQNVLLSPVLVGSAFSRMPSAREAPYSAPREAVLSRALLSTSRAWPRSRLHHSAVDIKKKAEYIQAEWRCRVVVWCAHGFDVDR